MRRGILILDWNGNKEPVLWKYEAEDYRQRKEMCKVYMVVICTGI